MLTAPALSVFAAVPEISCALSALLLCRTHALRSRLFIGVFKARSLPVMKGNFDKQINTALYRLKAVGKKGAGISRESKEHRSNASCSCRQQTVCCPFSFTKNKTVAVLFWPSQDLSARKQVGLSSFRQFRYRSLFNQTSRLPIVHLCVHSVAHDVISAMYQSFASLSVFSPPWAFLLFCVAVSAANVCWVLSGSFAGYLKSRFAVLNWAFGNV